MSGFFNLENCFFKFMTKIADLIILNFLWLVFSLPIITIGASTTALYYVTLKMTDNTEGYIFTNFVKSFKSNFKQATIAWLIFLFGFIILFIDFRYWVSFKSQLSYLIVIITTTILIIYFLVFLVYFPLLARFDNSLTLTLKNALIISFKNFFALIPLLFLLGLITYLTLKIPFVYFIMFIIGFSGFSQLSSYILLNIFKKYYKYSKL